MSQSTVFRSDGDPFLGRTSTTHNIGINIDISCIKVCQIPREMLKTVFTSSEGSDINVKAWKN